MPHEQPGSRRERIVLDRRSVLLDPRVHAVRPDLADVRLADRVFAPHYAAPVRRVIAQSAPLRAGRDHASPMLAMLEAGSGFELLDILGDDAWGTTLASAPGGALVGYLDVGVLADPEDQR